MEIFALIGQSGSGKSYKAILLSKKIGTEYIIDDGLLIKGNKIIAGKSAKRENTKIAAVKRAIFMDYNHRLCVREAIKAFNPKSILIIGTSEKMIKKITNALELGAIDKKIYIEDISSKKDREAAKHQRSVEGKHIIPVPTFEVKKDFSGYFMNSLKILKKKNNIKKEAYEKTVVRPTFSYLGRYKISDDVIKDIIKYNITKIDGIIKVPRIYIENYDEGISISIEIIMEYGYDILDVVRNMQKRISTEVEHMTSLNILNINVTVKGLKLTK